MSDPPTDRQWSQAIALVDREIEDLRREGKIATMKEFETIVRKFEAIRNGLLEVIPKKC